MSVKLKPDSTKCYETGLDPDYTRVVPKITNPRKCARCGGPYMSGGCITCGYTGGMVLMRRNTGERRCG